MHTNGLMPSVGPFTGSSKSQLLGPGEYEPPVDVLCSATGVVDDYGNVVPHFMNSQSNSFVYEPTSPPNASLWAVDGPRGGLGSSLRPNASSLLLDGSRRLPGDPAEQSTSVLLGRATTSQVLQRSCLPNYGNSVMQRKGLRKERLPGGIYQQMMSRERADKDKARRRRADEEMVAALPKTVTPSKPSKKR